MHRPRAMGTGRRQAGVSALVLVIILGVFLLLAGGGAVATLYLTGVIDTGQAAEKDAGDGADGEGESEPPRPPPQYLPLEPPLVVNFDRKGRVGYLQVSIELMAREKETIQALQQHMPVVRNALVLMMSSKSYEGLDERSEKEALREAAREEVNTVLKEQNVDGRVEAVYFTAFVMQ